MNVRRAWHTSQRRRSTLVGRKNDANKARAFPEMGCLEEERKEMLEQPE
jgi:hypothetical protein